MRSLESRRRSRMKLHTLSFTWSWKSRLWRKLKIIWSFKGLWLGLNSCQLCRWVLKKCSIIAIQVRSTARIHFARILCFLKRKVRLWSKWSGHLKELICQNWRKSIEDQHSNQSNFFIKTKLNKSHKAWPSLRRTKQRNDWVEIYYQSLPDLRKILIYLKRISGLSNP